MSGSSFLYDSYQNSNRQTLLGLFNVLHAERMHVGDQPIVNSRLMAWSERAFLSAGFYNFVNKLWDSG